MEKSIYLRWSALRMAVVTGHVHESGLHANVMFHSAWYMAVVESSYTRENCDIDTSILEAVLDIQHSRPPCHGMMHSGQERIDSLLP